MLDVTNAKAMMALFSLEGKRVKLTGLDDSWRTGKLTKIHTRDFTVKIGNEIHEGKWAFAIELDNEAGFSQALTNIKSVELVA